MNVGIVIAACVTLLGGSGHSAGWELTILSSYKSDAAISDFCGLEDVHCLDFGPDRLIAHPARRHPPAGKRIAADFQIESLFVIRDSRSADQRVGYRTLYARSGLRLALAGDPDALRRAGHVALKPVIGDSMVLEVHPPGAIRPISAESGAASSLDADRYSETLRHLSEDFPTRHSCTDGGANAADYLKVRFTGLGYDTVKSPYSGLCVPCAWRENENVIAVKHGRVHPNEYYLVGGHYDSISSFMCSNAPGSNDNGSGAAGILEVAEAFADVDTEATIIFAAFAGEEEGMLGSRAYLRSLVQAGQDTRIKGVMILDMISWDGGSHGLILEGSGGNQGQLDFLQRLSAACQAHTNLACSISTNYADSDHEPFLDDGLPGALLIESDWDSYPYYHTTNDLFEYQDADYALESLKLVAAVLEDLAIPYSGDDDAADDSADDAADDAADDDTQTGEQGTDDAGDDDSGDKACGCF